jgi:hypothetical protein
MSALLGLGRPLAYFVEVAPQHRLRNVGRNWRISDYVRKDLIGCLARDLPEQQD